MANVKHNIRVDDEWSPEAREAAAKARGGKGKPSVKPPQRTGISSLDPRQRREAIAAMRYKSRGMRD